ncbi:hypothetical protein GCM10017687_70670 [Streptomyces echinatus]
MLLARQVGVPYIVRRPDRRPDMVDDEEILELVELEVRDPPLRVRGSRGDDVPVVKVSALKPSRASRSGVESVLNLNEGCRRVHPAARA